MICFTAPAARVAVPYYELRTKLAMEGKTPDQIAESLEAAFVRGEPPRREEVTFAYMWSAHQHLGPRHRRLAPAHDVGRALLYERDGRRQSIWKPATPFTVIVMPVDGKPAVALRAKN